MSTGAELIPTETDAAVDAVQQQVEQARAQAEAVEVHDEASATLATELLREIQKRRKAAEADRKKLVGPIKQAAKEIDQRFKNAMAPYEEVDKIVRSKVQGWTDEQERIRREENERLERERQERERKAREERERQEAEARAKREQAEKEAREAEEEARKAKDADDAEVAEKLAAEAREAAAEAQTAESAIASLPEVELPKAVVPAAAKPDGLSTRKRWVATVNDFTALPDRYKVIDWQALREDMHAAVKETGAPPEIPGAEFKQESGLAVRA